MEKYLFLDIGEGYNLHPHLQLFSIMDSHIMPIQLYEDYRDSIFHSTSGIRDSNPSFICRRTQSTVHIRWLGGLLSVEGNFWSHGRLLQVLLRSTLTQL